jgi:hypothetical protein
MDSWHAAHLAALCVWGGLVAAEGVVELAPRTDDERRLAAELHYRMDLAVELPVLAAVVVTGAVLAARVWPLSPLHWAKIAAGLAAVGANLWCVVHVVVRRRQANEGPALQRHGRWVRVTASVGVPCAAVALVIGLTYFAQ